MKKLSKQQVEEWKQAYIQACAIFLVIQAVSYLVAAIVIAWLNLR